MEAPGLVTSLGVVRTASCFQLMGLLGGGRLRAPGAAASVSRWGRGGAGLAHSAPTPGKRASWLPWPLADV